MAGSQGHSQDMGLNHRDTEHTEQLVSVCSVPLW